ncbi:hypothetical protein KI387_006804, partial [Taxus chinensis]
MKRKAPWVPPGALVLGAFSLQLLSFLDFEFVSMGDYRETKEWSIKMLLRNELLVDGGRVMMCVYMGYLLPEMARSPSKAVVWSDMGALAIGISTHIFSELYVYQEFHRTLRGEGIPANPLAIVSRICTMVCSLFLFLCLGSAVFAGRTLYNLVLEKIPIALGDEPTEYSPKTVEKEVLQSWIVAWVCKPDYLIARSVLVSSVGVAVTLCVLCYAAEWITQDYEVLHLCDGLDGLRYTATAFMCLVTLMGWITICSRWIAAVIYFPGKYNIQGKGKLCYFLSEKIFFVGKFRSPVFGQGNDDDDDNNKYTKAIKKIIMPGEDAKRLWIANEKAIKQIKDFMRKGRKDGRYHSGKLVELMSKRSTGEICAGRVCLEPLDTSLQLPVEKKFDYLTKLSWKMTALSLIKVIVELLQDHNINDEVVQDQRANDAVEAYSQAYEFLDLLDNPVGSHSTYKSELYVRAADKQLEMIKRQLQTSKTGRRSSEDRTIRDPQLKVRRLGEEAQERIL